jgi:hypothetical protein
MEVSGVVVEPVAIDVVNDFAAFRPGDTAVLPFTATRPIPALPLRCSHRSMVCARASCDRRGCCRRRRREVGAWDNRDVPALEAGADRHPAEFLLVSEQGVSVAVPHLVVPEAKVPGGHRASAVTTCSAHDLASPSVLGRAMLLDSLVVHQAPAVRRVSPPAPIDRTELHSVYSTALDKALGNSMAVPVVRWIGKRIALVDAVMDSEVCRAVSA